MPNKTPPLAWDKKFTDYYSSGIFPGMLNRVCIYGYSRTGKSTLVHRLTKSERITFHASMPLDDLIGGWALVDGRTVWVDGPAVRALRQGRILHVDEGNNIPHECTTFVYALLDDPAGITLPSGERVEAAPGFGVVFTMNPDPSELPHPIYDRFDIYLKATTLSEGIRTALGRFADNAQNVIGFGQSKLDWTRPASVNAFLVAAKLHNRGYSLEDIANVIGWEGTQATDFMTAMSSK